MIIVSMRRPWCSRKVGGAAARLVPAAKCNELLSILDGERKRLVPDGLNATVLLNARLARHSADLHRAVWAPAHRSFESGTSLTCLRRIYGGWRGEGGHAHLPNPLHILEVLGLIYKHNKLSKYHGSCGSLRFSAAALVYLHR